MDEVSVAVESVCRPGVAIGIALSGCLVVWVPHFPPSPLLLLPPRLRLMRLMSTSLLVLPLSASPILLMSCFNVGAVVLIGAELVAVVTFMLLRSRPVACMVTPRPATPLDESELERARMSA